MPGFMRCYEGRERMFLLAAVLAALASAFLVSTTLWGMVLPLESNEGWLATRAEHSLFEGYRWVEANYSQLRRGAVFLFVLSFGTACLLMLRVLNPWARRVLRYGPIGMIKGSVALVLLLGSVAMVYRHDGLVRLSSTNLRDIYYLVIPFFSLLWFAWGEMGWAGNIKGWSMRPSSGSPERKPGLAILLGTLYGLAVLVMMALDRALFSEGFIQALAASLGTDSVARLLRPTIVIFAGFKALEIIGLFSLSAALAPSHMSAETRRARFLLPLAVFGLLGACFALGAWQARGMDYYKPGTAEAAGIRRAGSGPQALTVITAGPVGREPYSVERWTLTMFNPAPGKSARKATKREMTLQVSAENIAKLEAYAAGRPGSAYAQAARTAALEARYMLFDAEGVRKALFANAKTLFQSRLLLRYQIEHMPMEPVNAGLLSALVADAEWRRSQSAARVLVPALMRFGMKAEAEGWLEGVESEGGETAALRQSLASEAPAVGVINGSVEMNETVPPEGTRAVLLAPAGEDCAMTQISIRRMLVADRVLDAQGAFEFRGLAEGAYCLLLVAPDSPEMPSGGIVTIKDAPALITIATDSPSAELGKIRITLKR